MNLKGAERLLKLVEHLESGKLGQDEFDFTTYHGLKIDPETETICGTRGCAIGELPHVFPQDWVYPNAYTGPYWFNAPEEVLMETRNTSTHGQIFFDLTREEYQHLFLPFHQVGDQLEGDATALEVAQGIRKFLADNGYSVLEVIEMHKHEGGLHE